MVQLAHVVGTRLVNGRVFLSISGSFRTVFFTAFLCLTVLPLPIARFSRSLSSCFARQVKVLHVS